MTKQWSNPEGISAALRQNTNGFGTGADDIWDAVCFLGCNGSQFTKVQVAELITQHNPKQWAKTTIYRYVSAFFAYLLAAPDEDFSGPNSRLVRVRQGLYRLDDMPER